MNNIWRSLEIPEAIPFDNLLRSYYSYGKTAPFASNHELQELKIRRNYSQNLEFDIKVKQTLLEVTRSLGRSTFMSLDNFHAYEEMVSNSTTLLAGGSVKSLIDGFVYRASAMIEPPESVTFDAEYGLVGVGLPSEIQTTGINYLPSSIIDYRIVVSKDSMDAEKFLEEGVSYPTMAQKGQSVLHLSVLEPEPGGVHLERCIPNLIMKMYPAAKTLQKTVMRGALTDGSVWIFLILNMNPNGVGALYNYTLRVDPEFLCKGCPDEDGDDMIAGILASWIQRSCEPLSDGDWLEYYPGA